MNKYTVIYSGVHEEEDEDLMTVFTVNRREVEGKDRNEALAAGWEVVGAADKGFLQEDIDFVGIENEETRLGTAQFIQLIAIFRNSFDRPSEAFDRLVELMLADKPELIAKLFVKRDHQGRERESIDS